MLHGERWAPSEQWAHDATFKFGWVLDKWAKNTRPYDSVLLGPNSERLLSSSGGLAFSNWSNKGFVKHGSVSAQIVKRRSRTISTGSQHDRLYVTLLMTSSSRASQRRQTDSF